MINEKAVNQAVAEMQRRGDVIPGFAVAATLSACADEVLEWASAFSNRGGGTIILGLMPEHGYAVSQGFRTDPAINELRRLLTSLTPAVTAVIEPVSISGKKLPVATIPEMPSMLKPCFITGRGRYFGTFIRTDTGKRRLTNYESDRLFENRDQTKFDLEPVPDVKVEEMNPAILESIVRNARTRHPRIFEALSDETILVQLGIYTFVNGTLCPTLGGLLCAGRFPQRLFPKLQVLAAIRQGEAVSESPAPVRLIASQDFIGPIPDILQDAGMWLQTRLELEAKRSFDGDEYELLRESYALQKAFRAGLVNALQHRDYSPEGRGTPITVNVFEDRIDIQSPGGLYGVAGPETIGEGGIAATRNEYLSRMLTYLDDEGGERLATGFGSGLRNMRAALSYVGLDNPEIEDAVSFFRLMLPRTRRDVPKTASARTADGNRPEEKILAEARRHETVSVKELTELTGLARATLSKYIRRLVEEGRLEPTEPRQNPRQRYRAVKADD